MRKLFSFVLLIPLLEIIFVLLLAKLIGIMWTIVWIVATAIMGVYLMRSEGAKAMKQMKSAIENGQPPGPAMIDGMLIMIAGTLLLLPSFVADFLGLLLVFKPTRKLFKPLVFRWLRKKYAGGNVVIYKN